MSVRFEMRLTEADQAAMERQKARTGLEAAQVFRTLLHWADSGGKDYAPAQKPPPNGGPRTNPRLTAEEAPGLREGIDRITVGHPSPAQVLVPTAEDPPTKPPRPSWLGSRLDKAGYLKGKGIK